MILVHVKGPLRLEIEEEEVKTPRGKKTRGLIALLIQAKNFRRSRSFLQDKLWSDRGPEQAAASLRQSLSELRKCLGPHKNALITDAGCVQLDPNIFVIADFDANGENDFFEDLDIKDPQFEHWVRDSRQSFENKPATFNSVTKTAKPVVVLGITEDSMQSCGAAKLLKSEVSRSLLETGGIEVLDLEVSSNFMIAENPACLFVRIETLTAGHSSIVVARIETMSAHRVLWQSQVGPLHYEEVFQDQSIWQIRNLGQVVVANLLEQFVVRSQQFDLQPTAPTLFARAYKSLFRFDRANLIEADRLLKAAYEIEPHGSFLSWRAYIRSTAEFEHLTSDFLEYCDPNELHETALRTDGMNSNALLFAARHNFVTDGDPAFGIMLVDKALERNPSNPLGWGFRSNMLILENRFEDAVQAAERGLKLSEGQPMFPTLSIFSAMARMANQDLDRAVLDARAGTMTASKCQALRRYLFALFQALELPEKAGHELSLIRKREPEFTSKKLLDSNYPLKTLQSLKIAERLPN